MDILENRIHSPDAVQGLLNSGLLQVSASRRPRKKLFPSFDVEGEDSEDSGGEASGSQSIVADSGQPDGTTSAVVHADQNTIAFVDYSADLAAMKNQLAVLTETVQLLVDNMPRQEQPSSSSSSDRRADRPAISKAIKRSVKDLYADLALEGKQWETRQGERYDSPTNMQVTGNIRERSKAWYPDASKAELDAAIKQYFRSVRDGVCRKVKGKHEVYNKNSKRGMRLNRKLLRRQRALAAKSWSTEKKEKIMACLVTALMSSDDDDSDNEGQFLTRKLPWRSADMTKILIKLDKKAGDLLSPRGKLQKVPVIRVEEVSTRPAPTILPVGAEWALA